MPVNDQDLDVETQVSKVREITELVRSYLCRDNLKALVEKAATSQVTELEGLASAIARLGLEAQLYLFERGASGCADAGHRKAREVSRAAGRKL